MAIPGERFELNLDEEDDGGHEFQPSFPSMGFVKDILERPTSESSSAPTLPQAPTSLTGFPGHKKRARPSTFKQRARGNKAPELVKRTYEQKPTEAKSSEKQGISEENERRLNAMSAEEIEEERRELLATLSPKLIEQLMKRASADNQQSTSDSHKHTEPKLASPNSRQATVEDDIPVNTNSSSSSSRQPVVEDEKVVLEQRGRKVGEEEVDVDDRAPKTFIPDEELMPPRMKVHFPAPPKSPELDPSSPKFLAQLHEKYYPDLPSDPSKLSWMTPISGNEDTAYHPSQSELPPSALRFDFKGNLLPPRKAHELPVHLGLHHHGDAPGAAGYTVPELAHLARSSFPAQRCMAMQTLGRIFYRLGTGAYENEDITQGLWRCMKEGRVIEGLEEAASGKGTSHMSVKAYATEALWNWQKGGGQRWKAE